MQYEMGTESDAMVVIKATAAVWESLSANVWSTLVKDFVEDYMEIIIYGYGYSLTAKMFYITIVMRHISFLILKIYLR